MFSQIVDISNSNVERNAKTKIDFLSSLKGGLKSKYWFVIEEELIKLDFGTKEPTFYILKKVHGNVFFSSSNCLFHLFFMAK